MNTLEIDSHGARRARTRSLIQLASLIEKANLLETFQITLGLDLQKDVTMKEPITALFKGFLVLNSCHYKKEISPWPGFIVSVS